MDYSNSFLLPLSNILYVFYKKCFISNKNYVIINYSKNNEG